MMYRGHVEDGKVVFDGPVRPADGTRVQIEPAPEPSGQDSAQARSLTERLASVIGTVEGLPVDAAENLDHYLYGTPKAG